MEEKICKLDLSNLKSVELNPINIDFSKLIDPKRQQTVRDGGDNALDRLPFELKFMILAFLTVRDLSVMARLSKHWHDVSGLDDVWNKRPLPKFYFYLKHFGPRITTAKEDYRDNQKKAADELKRLVNFDSLLQSTVSKRPLFPLPQLNFPNFPAYNFAIKNDVIEGGNEDEPSKRFVIPK